MLPRLWPPPSHPGSCWPDRPRPFALGQRSEEVLGGGWAIQPLGSDPSPTYRLWGVGSLFLWAPSGIARTRLTDPEPGGPSRRPSSGPGPGLTAARLLPATAITIATPRAAEPRAEGRVALVAAYPLRPSVSSLSKRQAPPRGSEHGERPRAAEMVRRVGVRKCVN